MRLVKVQLPILYVASNYGGKSRTALQSLKPPHRRQLYFASSIGRLVTDAVTNLVEFIHSI